MFLQNICLQNIYKCFKTNHFSTKSWEKNFLGKIVNIQVLLLRSLSTCPNNQGKSDARIKFNSVRHCVKLKALEEYSLDQVDVKFTDDHSKTMTIICVKLMSCFCRCLNWSIPYQKYMSDIVSNVIRTFKSPRKILKWNYTQDHSKTLKDDLREVNVKFYADVRIYDVKNIG